MKSAKKLMVAATMLAMAVVPFAANAADATVVVHPGDMNGWVFFSENAGVTSSGSMVNGPETPPLGTGSANLNVVAANDGMTLTLVDEDYQGVKLADINELTYSTYRSSGGAAQAIALQFTVDADVDDLNDSFQGRLVYEPYHTQTVLSDEWQEWDTLDSTAGTGTGNWWFSNGMLATNTGCSQATPCTWEEVLAAIPNGGIHNTQLNSVVLKAGSGWTNFSGNVDALTIGVGENSITYDFELEAPLVLPSTPEFISPANGAVVETSDLDKIDWSDSTGGTYMPATYQYQAFADASYTTLIYSSGWLTDSEIATAGTPPNTYYIQVRAQDTMGNMTEWSNDASNPYYITVVADSPTVLVPTEKDQCKNGGFAQYTNPNTGEVFTNQGQCIKYVNTGK